MPKILPFDFCGEDKNLVKCLNVGYFFLMNYCFISSRGNQHGYTIFQHSRLHQPAKLSYFPPPDQRHAQPIYANFPARQPRNCTELVIDAHSAVASRSAHICQSICHPVSFSITMLKPRRILSQAPNRFYLPSYHPRALQPSLNNPNQGK